MTMKLMADEKGLMCPNCSGIDFDQVGTMEDGSLTCRDCKQTYVIKNAVPSQFMRVPGPIRPENWCPLYAKNSCA